MAKKIRFPLEMDNGVEVRSIEELGEHFSLEKVLEYFANGKLLTWLKDRYLDDKADAISELEQDDSELPKKICQIFDVVYDETLDIDMEKVAERKRKTELLEKYTSDERFFDVVDSIAFEQDDLYDLLDEDAETIYLCGERFSIPLSKKNVRYIGVNNPTVVIHAKELIDFEKDGISFEDVKFDEKYQKIVDESSQESEHETENWKREVLKEHGMSEWQIYSVAFNQEELNEMLGSYESSIYLYGEHFSIPLDIIDQEYINHIKESPICRGVDEHDIIYESRTRIKFEGINNPTITIESSLHDFCEKNVIFENVKFSDDNFRKANLVKKAFYAYYDYLECRREEKNQLSIYEVFNSTAFDQADLSRLIYEGVNPIYLTGKGPFYISTDKKNIKYIGRNCDSEENPTVIIDTAEYVYLLEKGIALENVNIDGMEYDSELEELDYMVFVEAYKERYPDESSTEETINKAYIAYKNFMKDYQKNHPEDTLESEESYKMFFENALTTASAAGIWEGVAGIWEGVELLRTLLGD